MAKSKKEKEAAPEKEHKKNWREVYASVEDIERYLSDHIQLRHNVITRRVECATCPTAVRGTRTTAARRAPWNC